MLVAPGDRHAGARAIEPDRGDHGGGFPVAMGTARHEALAARRPPPQAGHVRLGRRFVEEDEPAGRELALPGLPLPPRGGPIGPALFGGVERLFLYVSPRAMSA